MTAAGFPHSGIPGSRAVCASPGPIAACRALRRLPMPRHPPCAHDTLRPRGVTPGAEGLEHDGTWYLYQINKRKLLSSAMKMRKRSPLLDCSVKLLCANVFHDMEIRYSRYLRFESLCGSQGARESREPDAGTETVVQAGPPPADSGAPDSVFLNYQGFSLERR